MPSRLGASLALGAALLLFAAAPAAHAEDPVDLEGAYVLDTVGAISGSEAEVQSALDSLFARADIGLYVVYVDTFTNPADPVEWADQTAVQNFLGTRDLLLAVATGDRLYSMSIDDAFPLSDAQLDRVEAAVETGLRESDWAGAAIAGAQALEAEAGGGVGPNQPTNTPQEPAEGSGGIPILPIVGGVAVVGIGVFVYSRVRKKSKQDGSVAGAPEQMTQKQLDQRVGSLLVQLDDAVKTSEQELGFAVAQFGEAATADFTKALDSAKQKVHEAFAIKQKLDDAQSDSAEQQRAWTTQIIQLCEAADAELDAQADAFDALRELEKNAPQALATVREAAAAAAARRAGAAKALDALGKAYAATALTPVSGNLEQADKLLAYAGDGREQGPGAHRRRRCLRCGDPGAHGPGERRPGRPAVRGHRQRSAPSSARRARALGPSSRTRPRTSRPPRPCRRMPPSSPRSPPPRAPSRPRRPPRTTRRQRSPSCRPPTPPSSRCSSACATSRRGSRRPGRGSPRRSQRPEPR